MGVGVCPGAPSWALEVRVSFGGEVGRQSDFRQARVSEWLQDAVVGKNLVTKNLGEEDVVRYHNGILFSCEKGGNSAI